MENKDISFEEDSLPSNIMFESSAQQLIDKPVLITFGKTCNALDSTLSLEEIQKLSKKFPRSVKCLSKEEYEFKNMLIVSKLIIQSALQRKESRGAHYRLDYLNTNEKSKHSLLTKEEGELSFVK